MTRERILVTGATGFVGSALLAALVNSPKFEGWAGIRELVNNKRIRTLSMGDLGIGVRAGSLARFTVLVHCAARAGFTDGMEVDCLHEYRRINVDGTLRLAYEAAAAGVRRFIFISSIKVNGESTSGGDSFKPDDLPSPQDYYGQSKHEAETALMQLSVETGMEIVIIRPPLVYGPEVKGNFSYMIKFVEQGIPLPFGSVNNKRSLIGVDNLVDLIIRCIDHPGAANQVFLAGDGEDLSTSELLLGLGEAMGRPVRLFPVPAGTLQLGATLLGKKAMAQRLLGSLQVDISKTCDLLDWKPPYTVKEGLKRCFERSN